MAGIQPSRNGQIKQSWEIGFWVRDAPWAAGRGILWNLGSRYHKSQSRRKMSADTSYFLLYVSFVGHSLLLKAEREKREKHGKEEGRISTDLEVINEKTSAETPQGGTATGHF